MEVSALKYSGGIGLHGRAALLRLQSDERLVAFIRKGNSAAFETLVSRYESRLLAFCRHLLGSREDAEDVLQEVLAAAFNALLADERPINVRPWLYRIARNRSLNHLRRTQAVGVDSMDVHYSDNGASTADKVHEREEFRLLVGDIHELPETQKTALVLREMDALSYEQIAEAMETTVPSVKSLLVRARVSLAEAAEARLLSCEEVRIELAEVAEGLRRRPNPLVRRHLRACKRCSTFRTQLKVTNKALAALLPIGPMMFLRKLALTHLGHSAGAGSGATAAGSGTGAAASGAGAAGSLAAAGSTVVAGSTTGGFVSAGLGAIATKAAAGLAAAALVTAGAVEVDHSARRHGQPVPVAAVTPSLRADPVAHATPAPAATNFPVQLPHRPATHKVKRAPAGTASHALIAAVLPTKAPAKPLLKSPGTAGATSVTRAHPLGRTDSQSDPTVLPTTTGGTPTGSTPTSTAPTPGPLTPAPTSGVTAAGSDQPTTASGATGTPTTGTGTGGAGTGTGATGTTTPGDGTGAGTGGGGTGAGGGAGGDGGTGTTGTGTGGTGTGGTSSSGTGATPPSGNAVGAGTTSPTPGSGSDAPRLTPPSSGE
jgi:RNA polymerase sigma factor (sigma-70 family)